MTRYRYKRHRARSVARTARHRRIRPRLAGTAPDLEQVIMFCPGYNLGKAFKRVSRLFEEEFRSGELTLSQFAMLVNIGVREPATGTDVAERLGSDISTVSRTIEPLVERGLVQQARGSDRRVRVYRLTDAGRAALTRALPRWKRAKSAVLAPLRGRGWDTMLANLRRLAG
ncbi:MAG: MarR family transcriptional regulator [Spirochaetaceae bacterium]|nr:MAG: MarR family transcriptional regulator [Spirochaetaceae bacterium]